MIAYVLGNGRSRAELDLTKLPVEDAILIGCNYITKEIPPDYQVCVDERFYSEMEQLRRSPLILLDRMNKRLHYSTGETLHIFERQYPWNSGLYACAVGAIMGAETVYMLGMDFGSRTGAINHMHGDDTCKALTIIKNNYVHPRSNDVGGRVQRLVDLFPKTDFVRVGPRDDPFVESLPLFKMTYDEFSAVVFKDDPEEVNDQSKAG